MPTPTQIFITAALMRQQVILHVLLRVGARAWLVVSPMGWAHSPRLWALAGLFVVYDLALAVAIHNGRLKSFRIRWVLDVCDVTLWALLCPVGRPFTAAVVVAGPLVMAATIRWRVVAGLGCAVSIAGVVCGARLAAGAAPYLVDTLIYLGLPVLLGAAVPRLLHGEAARQERSARARREADLVAARLSGRNDVITGAGASVIDDLQVTIMQLTAANVDAAARLRASVGEHKQALGEQTRADALYLRDALDMYAEQRRRFEPRVARHVFFDLPTGGRTQVLSKGQADQLAAELNAASVAGVVSVDVASSRPGRALELRVAGRLIRLPTTGLQRIRLSVVPAGTLCLALWALTLSNPTYTAVPLRLTGPLALGIAAYAVASVIVIRRFGEATEPWLAVAAIVPFIVTAALTVHAASPDGPPRLILLGPLVGLALMYGTVIAPRPAVYATRLCLLVATTIAIATSPPLAMSYLAAELIWPCTSYLGAYLIAHGVSRLGADLSVSLSGQWQQSAVRARAESALDEITYLRHVAAEGQELCDRADSGVVRDGVEAELTRLRDRLAELEASLR